ncbi:MAG TPA: hypothetical protein VFZ23_17970 [Pyrinomonadaceae bacterium]
MPIRSRILLQTSIPFTEDDWHVGRFSLLAEHLRSLRADNGDTLYAVTTRNRESDETGNDALLSNLDESEFDQLWLFAVDAGTGLTSADCSGITRFRKRGGGIFSTRDHFDLGSSLCTLGGIGAAHYFHSVNPDPDPTRRQRDDRITESIDYPNYHSGANGDFQRIEITAPHELLRRADRSFLEFFPAHPHEGGVGAPGSDESARVIATGMSLATGRTFNLVVAFEHRTDAAGNHLGRAIAESSFHHVVDYNWDVDAGCPSFVEEPPGDGYKRNPEALEDIKQYVSNVARWLSPMH